ncbi:hypothetical protein I4U23_023508 [Adineta vaga]|nr:hypothetical protein I4U23_023508 [Adineta vaga]
MFETIIASFIKRYLIRYIDINVDQLSAQILSKQQITIDNLIFNITTINADIRKKFSLPLRIESIDLGQIQCSFVWSSLFFRSTSAAFIIKVQHVHIVCKNHDEQTSTETNEEIDEKYKRNQLDLAEQQFEKEWECFGEVKRSRWNVQRLLMSFFEKLQIEVYDVHISYRSLSDQSIGFTCQQIQILNKPCAEMMSRQVIRIDNPGLYITTNMVSKQSYILSLENSMEISLTHNHFLEGQQEYRYEFECLLTDLNIKCNVEQIRILADLIRCIQHSNLYRRFTFDTCRPQAKISKQSVRVWWRYAILSVLRLQAEVKDSTTCFWFNRSLFIHRLHRLNAYARLYRVYLLRTSNSTNEDKSMINEIEKEFDLEHLLIIRRSIFQCRINEQISQKREEITPWYFNYAQWLTSKMIDLWGQTTINSDEPLDENDIKIQDQVNTFIADSLEDEDLLESCHQAQIFRFNFVIKSIQIDLLSSSHVQIFNIDLKNFSLMAEIRLRHRSLMFSIRLDDFIMRDLAETNGFTTILSSNRESEQVPMLEFIFERRGRIRNSVRIHSCGLSITCCPASIERLYQFCVSTLGESSMSMSFSLTNWKRIKHYIVRNYRSILEEIMSVSKVRNIRRRNPYLLKKNFQIYVNIAAFKITVALQSQEALVFVLSCLTLSNDTRNEVNEDEFLTPISSPPANDDTFDVESTYYSMNLITIDQTSETVVPLTFTFSIRNIQIGNLTDIIQIIEISDVCFLIHHQYDYLWPFVNISGVFPKTNLCLDVQQIRSLYNGLTPWITFIKHLINQQSYQCDIWPEFSFCFEETRVILNDNFKALCDLRVYNVALAFVRNSMTCNLDSLTIFDCIQKTAKNDEILLKIEQAPNKKDGFIRINMGFEAKSTLSDIDMIIDVNTNKLDFVLNPQTICILLNYFSTMNLFTFNCIPIENNTLVKSLKKCELNIKCTQMNLIIVNPLSTVTWPTEVQLQNVTLNTILYPNSTCEMMISNIKILNRFDNSLVVHINIISDQSEIPAVHVLIRNEKDKDFNLIIKVCSFSYVHSNHLLNTIQETYRYINQACHFIGKQTFQTSALSLLRWTLCIDVNTSTILLSNDIGLQLGHIRIQTNHERLLDFDISINQLDLIRKNFILEKNVKHIDSLRFLENMSLCINLEVSDSSITINVQLTNLSRIYLSQIGIQLLSQILQTISTNNLTSSSKFLFHLQSTQIVIIFQTNRQNELITICEALLNQCQMIYELNDVFKKNVLLRFDSISINNRLTDLDESLIALTSPTSIQLNSSQMNDEYEQLDMRLGKINVRFVKSTWKLLLEMMQVFNCKSNPSLSSCSNIEEKKNDYILFNGELSRISMHAESISCLFQDNEILLMNIDLQGFTFQIRTYLKQSVVVWSLHSQLDFISIRDLTIVDQLYSERLCTDITTKKVIELIITTDDIVQLDLKLTAIRYIHTQNFLLKLLEYFYRFQQNEDFYKRIILNITRQSTEILWNVAMGNLTLVLPEDIRKPPVLILQLDSIYFNNQSKKMNNIPSQLYITIIEIKNITLHSSGSATSTPIRLSNNFSSLVRKPFNINMTIEHNPTVATYTIKMNLSSIDFLLDSNHYYLLQNIFYSNFDEQSIVKLSNLFYSIFVSKNEVSTSNLILKMKIDHVGLEIFLLKSGLLTFEQRHSLGYTELINFHLSFDQYSNGHQILHLHCSTIKLIDTRVRNEDMIMPLFTLSNPHQLEIHLNRTKHTNQCTITLNCIRIVFVIDWFIELNNFLHIFCQQPMIITNDIPFSFSEVQLNLNQFELILVSTLRDPYATALIYSSTMIFNYASIHRSTECFITDLTMLTCQIGNINETSISIIEPTDCSLFIHSSNEIFDEYICELNIPILNIRISYSDVQMLYSLFHTISQQISQVQTRKPLLTTISTLFTSPIRDCPTSTYDLLNIKFVKFICTEICLCLIDDCFGINIPLLNIHLKPFQFQTIEHTLHNRIEHCEFELTISYYNRFQSGFEPLIETCSLQIVLMRTSSTTSLLISSKETLNLNFTQAFYRLYNTIKKNWTSDKQISKQKTNFRQVKPLEPYCFTNLLGNPIKFRTWISSEQIFSTDEHIVSDNQTISFSFQSHSPQIKKRKTSIVTSLFQTDRRILITIDDWQCLQPISIDRIGTFFRIATSYDNAYFIKPTLVLINIAITENSIRSITVKSSIEIRNQLLTAVDVRCESCLDMIYEFRLEPNESRSLPIQFSSMLKHMHVRPADFTLGYCDEPISWFEIEQQNSSKDKTINRQSFLRTCSFDGKEAVYYMCVQSKQTCLLNNQDQLLSVYELSIHSPLTICNLLPCSLTLEIPPYRQKFEISSYKFHREHTLNILENIDLLFTTNLYRMNKSLHLPSINDLYQMKYTYQRVIFYDNIQRELFVDIKIVCAIKYRLKVFISVPYILLNKSGIPLIFKDSNSKLEAAGQNTDDEVMLNREPLLFSFDNSNRNNTCVMRVGTGLQHHQQDGRPQWSSKFSLQHGSSYRQLQVRSSRRSIDWTYSIAIDIRPGNDYLKRTNFIFLSARYIIYNQCSYDLLITQRAIAHEEMNYLKVSKQATVAYHWPRTDMEQFLCVQIIDDQQYQFVHWSGGFPIDSTDAFHINMRNENNQCFILRVQVIERNETYFVVFMDANRLPAPFRISNRSNIPIQFYQTDIRPDSTHLITMISPYQSVDYAWDEPTLKPMITCSIMDGTKATYDLLKLGSAEELYSYNYIYLAFQATFENEELIQISDSSSYQLVIEFNEDRIFLAQRQENKRSQLWYMTNHGVLIHIGSLSATPDGNKKKDFFDDLRQTYVLDIHELSNTNWNNLTTNCTQLTVRRYDPKRIQTQSWQFTNHGYLCLKDAPHMCVQVFGELRTNSDVFLGSTIENINQIPLPTMYIRLYQRYPGSGVLYVCVKADGPTNVLEIDSIKSTDSLSMTTVISTIPSTVYHLDLHLPSGVGISIVNSINHESEELIYMLANNIHIQYDNKDHEQSIEATINTLIISNQLLTTTKPYFLHVTFADNASVQSAIHFQIKWQKLDFNFNLLHIIHSCQIDINSISIQLDELLLWKLIEFFDIEVSSLSSLLFTAVGIGNMTSADRKIGFNIDNYETNRMLSLLTSTHATRIYFHRLNLSAIDLNLSVYCIPTKRYLSSHLLAIKRQASFPLVPFENAQIHLKSYEQTHISNTYDFFLLSITTHYIHVCTRQALKILGSVDFLGNPLGLLHDVTDGLVCLTDQRGVSGLVKNVAHGVADSASKVTGSLSHGIGKLVPDHEQNHRRTTIADNHRSSTIGQAIRHGTAGLAAGFYGGLTSIIKQPYKGAVEEGVPGLMKGFAKGIVGTVSKPVVGILDFTNEMATVIKEGARSSNIISQTPIRPTRCPANILGLLQSYSLSDAQGHYLLYKMNNGDLTERYISRCTISTISAEISDKKNSTTNNQRNKITLDRIDAMITTQRVIMYRTDDNPDFFSFEIIYSYDFNTPMTVNPIEDDNNHVYIQFLFDVKTSSSKSNALHRCNTLEQASILSRDIQRAQEIFREEKLIYITSNDEVEDHYNEIFEDQQIE